MSGVWGRSATVLYGPSSYKSGSGGLNTRVLKSFLHTRFETVHINLVLMKLEHRLRGLCVPTQNHSLFRTSTDTIVSILIRL